MRVKIKQKMPTHSNVLGNTNAKIFAKSRQMDHFEPGYWFEIFIYFLINSKKNSLGALIGITVPPPMATNPQALLLPEQRTPRESVDPLARMWIVARCRRLRPTHHRSLCINCLALGAENDAAAADCGGGGAGDGNDRDGDQQVMPRHFGVSIRLNGRQWAVVDRQWLVVKKLLWSLGCAVVVQCAENA